MPSSNKRKSNKKDKRKDEKIISVKVDRAQSIQKVFRKLRAMVCTERINEIGQGEGNILKLDNASDLLKESENLENDSSDFDEFDKNNTICRTLDNFCIYDKEGKPFDLSRLLKNPELAEDIEAFGTVMAPLSYEGLSLTRISRSYPRDGDEKLVNDLVCKKLSTTRSRPSGGDGGGGSRSSSSRTKSNMKLPDYNPDLTREQAWADANVLYEQTDIPYLVGGITIQSLGRVVYDNENYHSRTHIFAVGFKSERMYASAINPQEKALHTSEILQGIDGPIFQVTHEGGTPQWEGPSSSNVWQAVLTDVNKARERMGMTRGGDSVSGPEMYGFANPKVASVLEGLENVLECSQYLFRAKRPGGSAKSYSRSGGNAKRNRTQITSSAGKAVKSNNKIEETKKKSVNSDDINILVEATQKLIDIGEEETSSLNLILTKLSKLDIDRDSLISTGLGRQINRLRKHSDKEIASLAKSLKQKWKSTMDENALVSKETLNKMIDIAIDLGKAIGFGVDGKGEALEKKLSEMTFISSVDELMKILKKLENINYVTMDVLVETGTGKPVSKLRKHLDEDVQNLANKIKSLWEYQIAESDGKANGINSYNENETKKVNKEDKNKNSNNQQLSEGVVVEKEDTNKESAIVGEKDEGSNNVDEEQQQGAPKKIKLDINTNENMNRISESKNSSPKSNKSSTPKNKKSVSTPNYNNSGIDKNNDIYDGRRKSSRSNRKRKLDSATVSLSTSNSSGNKSSVPPALLDAVAKRIHLEEHVSLKHTVADRMVSKLRSPNVNKMVKVLSTRANKRVHITNIKGISFTHGEYDAILFLETETARYRIAGYNVPVAPAVNYSNTFVKIWKSFESCRRFIELLEEEDMSIDSALKTIVDDERRPCPRRVFEDGDKIVEDFLSRDDVLDNTMLILNQITRGHKKIEKVQKWLETKQVQGLVARKCRLMPSEERDAIRGKRQVQISESKASQREELRQKRMIEEGIGLPDDLEVVENDKILILGDGKGGLESIENEFIRNIATKQQQIQRPVPLFFPFDLIFQNFDNILSFNPASINLQEGDFKTEPFGIFGHSPEKTKLDLNVSEDGGLIFSELLGLWIGFKFLAPLFNQNIQDELENFATFRLRFVKSENPEIFVALINFLSQEGAKILGIDVNQYTNKVNTVAVEETGIATRRGRRSNNTRVNYQEYVMPEAMHVPSYPYDVDNLWPVPESCVDDLSWSEAARRALIYQLQLQEKSKEGEDMDVDDEPDQKILKKLTTLQKALKIEPDLMSTCDEIIAELIEDPVAAPFTAPVSKADAPTYFDVVSRPMDLQTIQNRIRAGHYDVINAPPNNRYNVIVEWRDPVSDDEDEDDAEEEKKNDDENQIKKEEENNMGPIIVTTEKEYQIQVDKRFYDSDCFGAGHAGVAADVRQVWSNCKAFNKSHTKIYTDSKKLAVTFKKLYDEKILARDPKLIYGYDINESGKIIKDEEINGDSSNVDSDIKKEEGIINENSEKPNNTLMHKSQNQSVYENKLPSLESVVLEFASVADFSKLPLKSKLRVGSSLLEMALDTSPVLNMIKERIEIGINVSKEYFKKEREDQKKEKELFAMATTKELKDELENFRQLMTDQREKYEVEMKNYSVRLEPLGTDRFFNRYWILDSGASPLVHVELARTGKWGVFASIDATEKLIDSLDPRGRRENALQRVLIEHFKKNKASLAEKITKQNGRIEMYSNIKAGKPIAVNQEKVSKLNEQINNLKKESEDPSYDNFREAVANNGKKYFYNRETRETWWEKPRELIQKDKLLSEIKSLEGKIISLQKPPEDMIKILKEEFVDDMTLQNALITTLPNDINKEEKLLTIQELANNQEKTLEEIKHEGYRDRVNEILSTLLILKDISASSSAKVVRCCDLNSWIDGIDDEVSPEKKWTTRIYDLAKKTLVLIDKDCSIWFEKVLPEIKELGVIFFKLFIGSPYDMHDEIAQISVVSACKHEYRWIRALNRTKRVSELALLMLQLTYILNLTNKESKQLREQKPHMIDYLKSIT